MNKLTPKSPAKETLNAKTETQAKTEEKVNAQETVKAEEKPAPKLEFYSYNSSLESTQMISDVGARIRFVNYKYITKEPAIVEYLDKEIASGACPYISKGPMVETDIRDPMEALKAKHFEEFKELQRQEAMARAEGFKRDLGQSAFASGLNALNADSMPN